MAADGGLDRAGGEVLTVDAQPVRRASREEQEALVVDVAEVARPVPAAPQRRLGRFGVVVVALERTRTGGVDDLPDALVCVDERSVRADASGRQLVAFRI